MTLTATSWFQCEHCGDYFKITTDDLRDDNLLEIYCPACGLVSESYLTEDVIELAKAIVRNHTMDMIYDAFKGIERKSKKGDVRFNALKKPMHKDENPIISGIEALEIVGFQCCTRTAKIKPLLKMTACYCPFCGVKEYEIKQS